MTHYTTLTELFSAQQQPSNMSRFFQQLMDWADNNDMVVNFNKTKEMIMGPPSKTSLLPPLQ